MMLPVYYFYCAECEQKTKAMLYFRTWCPCKESNVITTTYTIEYHGMAVPQDSWEAMDENIPPIIGPTNYFNIDFVRKHR